MAAPDFGSVVPQYPLNAAGTLGQNAAFALGRFYCGTGGMPVPTRNNASGVPTGLRTTIGFNTFGVTMVGTGLYELSHAPANIMSVFPQYVGPSGQAAVVTPQLSPGNSASGVVRIQATRTFSSGSGATPPSGFMAPFNPPSGSRFDVLFHYNSRNDQGLTQY